MALSFETRMQPSHRLEEACVKYRSLTKVERVPQLFYVRVIGLVSTARVRIPQALKCFSLRIFLESGSGHDGEHPAHSEQQQLTGQTEVNTRNTRKEVVCICLLQETYLIVFQARFGAGAPYHRRV